MSNSSRSQVRILLETIFYMVIIRNMDTLCDPAVMNMSLYDLSLLDCDMTLPKWVSEKWAPMADTPSRSAALGTNMTGTEPLDKDDSPHTSRSSTVEQEM